MERVNEFVFYELAIKIHQITTLSDSVKYSEVWYSLWQARDALDEIYRQRPLNFTTPVAYRLYQALTAAVPKDWANAVGKLPQQGQPEEEIPVLQVWEIREAAKEFETILRTECEMMDTYFVSKKGTYSTKDLVENAHYQVPEPIRERLPNQTRIDFDQAGKCTAFDVPTAAAFHLLRGTEAVVRIYYERVVPGPKLANPKMRNWGAYIKLLSKYGADTKVTSLLTHLKDVYRNPVLHPEENYTDDSVQVLWGVCISAVVLMENAIKKIDADKGGEGSLLTAGRIQSATASL